MSTTRKILLGLLVIAMVVSIVIFWGSVFSILMAMCLILMIPALLLRHVLNRDNDDYFGYE